MTEKFNAKREEIKDAIMEFAKQLGHPPSVTELKRQAQIPHDPIRKHFGSYTNALRECNMARPGRGKGRASTEELFLDWANVTRKLGRVPNMLEHETYGKFSPRPLAKLYCGWRNVGYGLKLFAEEQGLAEEWKAELALLEQDTNYQNVLLRKSGAAPEQQSKAQKMEIIGPVYGPPIWPGLPLAHGPVNEMGVVFLFGAMAQQLGFVVHRLQSEFPDCEAVQQVEGEKWRKVRIEFEYESKNFLRHMHEVRACDLIVCWHHNWPQCPLEVIELKKVIGQGQADLSSTIA